MAVENGVHQSMVPRRRRFTLANRVSTGPTVARMNTYGVATGAIAATVVPASPMITSENSPGDQGGAGPQPSGTRHPVAAGGVRAGGHLRQGRHRRQHQGHRQHRQQVLRVHRQADRHEEHRREQVAQRRQHGAGPVGGLPGQRQAHQEGAHGGRGVQVLGDGGDDQRQPEDPQQQLFVVGCEINRPT